MSGSSWMRSKCTAFGCSIFNARRSEIVSNTRRDQRNHPRKRSRCTRCRHAEGRPTANKRIKSPNWPCKSPKIFAGPFTRNTVSSLLKQCSAASHNSLIALGLRRSVDRSWFPRVRMQQVREHSFVHRLRPELGRSARARYFRRSISRGEHVRTGRADSSRFVLKLIDRERPNHATATPLGVDFESNLGNRRHDTARWCKRTSDVGVRRMLSGELSRAKPGDSCARMNERSRVGIAGENFRRATNSSAAAASRARPAQVLLCLTFMYRGVRRARQPPRGARW